MMEVGEIGGPVHWSTVRLFDALGKAAASPGLRGSSRGEKMGYSGRRRYAMGDKGKKDKDKGQKQKKKKQDQEAKKKREKQPKRTHPPENS